MRQKRSAGQTNDDMGQGRLLLEDTADSLEELSLKGWRIENLADRIVFVVFRFTAVLRDEHAEMELLAQNQVTSKGPPFELLLPW